MRFVSRGETCLTQILQLLNMIGVKRIDVDDTIRKAVRLADEKGVPVNHILAELLIYHYLRGRGYSFVSIEESTGLAKCDVYAIKGGFDVCVEIDFYSVPHSFSLNRTRYILARHLRKMLQVAKSGVRAVVFAYPYGYIPLLPIELVKPVDSRSRERILDMINRVRELTLVENSDVDYLMRIHIHGVLIFDIDSGKVYELSPDRVEGLVNMYSGYVEGD